MSYPKNILRSHATSMSFYKIILWLIHAGLITITGVASCAALNINAAETRVVMAAAYNYGLREYRRFVLPLREVYDGDIVVFTKNPPREVVTLCSQYNVTMRELKKTTHLGVKGDRYAGYTETCKKYHMCLATDFRDTFFQSDPFRDFPGDTDLILSGESRRIRIGKTPGRPYCSPRVTGRCTCPYNEEWIQTCWGEHFASSLNESVPICSGVFVGTPQGFFDLQRLLLMEMKKSSKKRYCKARDQGHVNFLYYSNQFPRSFVMQPQGDGIVNTVGYIARTRHHLEKHLDSSGRVVNSDGSLSPVVHQYDRFPELVKLLDDKVETLMGESRNN